MASATVTRRQRMAGSVASAAREHAAEVAERLEPLLARAMADGGGFGLRRLQEACGLVLDEARRDLEAADEAHIEELRSQGADRERRDRAAAELHDRLVRVRGVCEALYGAGASARLFGLRGRTSRQPVELRAQARRVVHRLRNPQAPLPPPADPMLIADPVQWLARLEERLRDLEASLRTVRLDRREQEATLRRKHEARARFDRTQSAVTTVLAGLYHLADCDTYEERLRPKRGRPRRKATEAAPEMVEAAARAVEAAEKAPMAEVVSSAAAGEAPRAVADGAPALLAEPAAAVGFEGGVTSSSAIAAPPPVDFSGAPTTVAHAAGDFFDASATGAPRAVGSALEAQPWNPAPTASTTSPRWPATHGRTSTSTPASSGCGWSSGRSTRTIPAPTTSSTPTARGGRAPT